MTSNYVFQMDYVFLSLPPWLFELNERQLLIRIYSVIRSHSFTLLRTKYVVTLCFFFEKDITSAHP
jgi:hypothetical protein